MRCSLNLPICAGALLAAIHAAMPAKAASNYPHQSIKIIVCVPAGGGVDTATRIVAEKLQQKLGQTVTIENRGGQSGNIGTEAVATAAPDGYTLLAAQPAPLTVNAFLYTNLKYNPTKLEPVAVLTSIATALLVRSDFPAKTAQELVAVVRAKAGKFSYASQGNGSTAHLTSEFFQSQTGTKLTHIPYRGTFPALQDLSAGRVDLMFVEIGSAMELHRSGKARILAVASKTRVPTLPDIPTLAESGLPAFAAHTWNAIAAPPKTPAAITQKLNDAINDILKMPDIRTRLSAIGMQPVGGSRESMSKLIKDDVRHWGDVIRKANITIN